MPVGHLQCLQIRIQMCIKNTIKQRVDGDDGIVKYCLQRSPASILGRTSKLPHSWQRVQTVACPSEEDMEDHDIEAFCLGLAD
jgi:hypothetical protein